MRPKRILSLTVGIIFIVSSFTAPSLHSQNQHFTYVVIGAFTFLKNAETHHKWAIDNGLDARFAMNPNRELYYVYSFQTRDLTSAVDEVYKVRSLVSDAWVYTGPLNGIDGTPIVSNVNTTSAAVTGVKNNTTTTSKNNVATDGKTVSTSTGSSSTTKSTAIVASRKILTGKTTPGKTITTTVGGKTYSTKADDQGNWRVDTQASTPISTVNTASAVPFKSGAAILEGTTGPGEEVVISTNGSKFTAKASPNGKWVLTAADLQHQMIAQSSSSLSGNATAGSNVKVTVAGATYSTVADASGNWKIDTKTEKPTSVTPLASGLSADASVYTGTGTPESKVAVVIGGKTYSATTDPSGNWKLSTKDIQQQTAAMSTKVLSGGGQVPGSTMKMQVAGANYSTTVDNEGNWVIDTSRDKPVSMADVSSASPIFGGTAKAGSKINIAMNGSSYVAIANDAGNWSTNSEELIKGQVESAASRAGSSGRKVEIVAARKVLTGKAVAGNDITTIINGKTYTTKADKDGDWTIDTYVNRPVSVADVSEFTPGDAIMEGNSKPNADVLVSMNGATYTVKTNAQGKWSLSAADIQQQMAKRSANVLKGTAEAGKEVKVNVAGATYSTIADASGNWTLDTKESKPISMAANSSVKSTAAAVYSGTAKAGSKVDVEINGKTYTATANQAGNWNLNTVDIQKQTVAMGTKVLSGSAQPPGSIVEMEIAGASYSTIADENGNWTIDSNIDTPVSTHEQGGPLNAESAILQGTTDPGSEVEVSVNGSNYIAKANEDGYWSLNSDELIKGQVENSNNNLVTGVAKNGTKVMVEIDGSVYETTVGSDGKWAVDPDNEQPISTAPANSSSESNGKVLMGTGGAGELVSAVIDGQTYRSTIDQDGNWKIDTTVDRPIQLFASVVGEGREGEAPVLIEGVGTSQGNQVESRPPGLIPAAGLVEPNIEEDYKVYVNSYFDEGFREIKGPIEVLDFVRGRKLADSFSHTLTGVNDPKNGKNTVQVASRIFGYRPYSVVFDLTDPVASDTTNSVSTYGDSIIIDMPLQRLQRGDIAVMWNVLFFKDAAIMRPESRPELNSLLEMLNSVADMEVILHGHTNGSSVGKIIHLNKKDIEYFSMNAEHSTSKGSAKKLSEERAYTIQEWLISQGISEDRMEIKGWGGKRMLFESDDPNAFRNVRVEVEIK